MPVFYGVCLMCISFTFCLASDLQEKKQEIQTQRSFGLEEVALFFIGNYTVKIVWLFVDFFVNTMAHGNYIIQSFPF